MKNKLLIVLLIVAAVIGCGVFAGCSGGGDADYTVGILQQLQHVALDQANKGFQDELKSLMDAVGKTVKFSDRNASGDIPTCSTIANTFVNQKVDLILSIATDASKAAKTATVESKTPVLFTAVTAPADPAVNLVESNEVPGGNVSGTSDLNPVTKQIELMTKLVPNATKFGVLYSTSETNSVIQVALAREACEAYGIELKEQGINDLTELKAAMSSLKNAGVQALYIPTDNKIANGAATIASTNITENYNFPIVCGEEGMNDQCGVATYGIDYYKLGQDTARMAFDILYKGEDVSKMAVRFVRSEDAPFSINEENAEAIGFTIPAEVKALANA